MTNELIDILLDTIIVSMLIMFGTSFLFIIRIIIEDVDESVKAEREKHGDTNK
jgi:hypothetical protein